MKRGLDAEYVASIDLSDPLAFSDGIPFEEFERLQQHAPVYWQETPAGGSAGGLWWLTRHADLVALSRNTEDFSSQAGANFPVNPGLRTDWDEYSANGGPTNGMLFMDPPRHTHVRKLVSSSFTPRVIAHFVPWITDIVNGALDGLPGEPFDFVPAVAEVIPGSVIAQLLGMPDADRPLIVEWNRRLFDAQARAEQPALMADVNADIFEYAVTLRDRKQREPGVDIITELINQGDALTEHEYLWFFKGLMSAGFETTHTTMSQAVALMLTTPTIYEAVDSAGRRGDSTTVVEELLRYVSPVLHMSRTAKRDVRINDVDIAAGEMVVMWYVAANRDSAVFVEPHEFDPNRRPNPHLAFGGGGAHFCLGANLARLEMRILLEELHNHRIHLELAAPPVRGFSTLVNQLTKLPVQRV